MKNKRRKSLGGVVLITVTIVMFVLIIMLLAALTVVQTAGQRINTKYEENQAYYTARSALDVFTENMLKDGDLEADGQDYRYTKTSVTPPVEDIVPMYQGFALELDAYSLAVVDDSGNLVPGANILQSDLNSSGEAANHVEYQTYFGVADPAVTSITYEITNFPVVSGTNSGMGRLYDSTTATATIKLEVLSREYSVDDSMWGAGTSYATKEDLIDSGADGAEAMIKGKRKEDKMSVKVTATVEYMGYEGIAILIYNTGELPENNSSRAITTFGGAGSDNMSIIGGASMADDVTWGNLGYIYGSVYAEKNFTVNTGPTLNLTDGESFYVGGDLTVIDSNFKVVGYNYAGDANDRPFVYIAGKLGGSALAPDIFSGVDVITHGLTASNNFQYNGGNFYCVGNLDLTKADNIRFDGDIYVQGNIYLKENFANSGWYCTMDEDGNIASVNLSSGGTGRIYLNGGYTSIDSYGNVTATVPASSVTSPDVTSFTNNIDLPTDDDVKNPASGNKTITLSLPGSLTKELPTHVDNFNHYYQTDADGDLIDSSGNKITDPTTQSPVPISAQEKSNAPLSDMTLPLTAANLGITENMKSLACYSNTSAYVEGIYTDSQIDTAGGTVRCIYDSSGNNKVHIKGGGTVEMVVTGAPNENIIVVDDDTTLIVYGDTSSSDIWFAKFEVYTETTAKAKNGDTLAVGNKEGCGIKVPKIQYYISGNGTFNVQNNAMLTGYYYGPDSTLNLSAASTPAINMTYNNNPIGSKNVAIVGSLLCKTAVLPNQTGVAYINPKLDEQGVAGKPIHTWDSGQYTRN